MLDDQTASDARADSEGDPAPSNPLLPKIGEFPVGSTVSYQSLHLTDLPPVGDRARRDLGKGGSVSFFEPLDESAPDGPAVGVLLTHRQGWYQQGLALGELLHSLCLAPGEVTKIAVIDWERRESARDQSATTQAERVSDTSNQQLSASEVQEAMASETQSGSSLSFGSSTQSQAGGNAGFLFGGASASAARSSSLGLSSSMSTGTRDISAESTRNISQRTQEISQATRSRRATSIREVNQGETENVTTRVVANYNRMHALTVEYFEVLQVYQIETRVEKAERVIFIPMTVGTFGKELSLDRYRQTLIAIASDLDLPDMRALLFRGEEDTISDLEDALQDARKTLEDARAAQRTAAADKPNHGLMLQDAIRNNPPSSPQAHVQLVVNTQREFVQRITAYTTEIATAGAAVANATTAFKAAEDRLREARDVKRVADDEVAEYFNRERLLFNQLMWMRLDPYHVHLLLKDLTFQDIALVDTVDPKPIGVFGGYLAFRWNFGEDIPGSQDREMPYFLNRQRFERRYIGRSDSARSDATVVLPTKGLFAEAVLGSSNSAEQIDLKRFWDWDGSPIPILPPELAPIDTGSRAQTVGTASTALDPSLAAIRGAPALSNADLSGILSAVGTQGIFANMSGIEAAIALASKAADGASEGAGKAAQSALDAQKAYGETLVGLANSEAGKAAVQMAVSAVAPQGKAATVMGGLMNANAAEKKDGG